MKHDLIKIINQNEELTLSHLKEVFTKKNITNKASFLNEAKQFVSILNEVIEFAEKQIVENYAKQDVDGNLITTEIMDENGVIMESYYFEEKKANDKIDYDVLLESLKADGGEDIARGKIYEIIEKPKTLTELKKKNSGIPADLLEKCTIKGKKTGEIVLKQKKFK